MPTADPEPVLQLEQLDAPVTAVSPPAAVPSRRVHALPLAIAVVLVLGGSALFMSGYSLGRQMALQPGTPAADQGVFIPFWDTYDTINERYAGGDVDRQTLVQGAIRGMIDSLGDPYSAYMTSDEYRQSLQGISGQFEGIGAEIATQAPDGTPGCATLGPACLLVIADPLEGSPARLAGLLAGDFVIEADGVSFDGLTVENARDKIRGPKGTVVRLTIVRAGGTPFEVAITRDVVQSREVESKVLANGTVGYIQLKGFSDVAARQFDDALEGHLAAGRTALVLDLRGNPGGYVTAARSIASQLIGSGVIFWEQDATGLQVPTEATPGGLATDPSIRLVCLIDGGSASASEILAGALQDSGRATLVGQTSFGKGTVQQWQELSGEGGAFRLTIARWLTPDKRWIHGKGLTPDVPVALPDPLPVGSDPTLDRAVELLEPAAARPGLRAAA
jgi:carboxyl-terminal processing protease